MVPSICHIRYYTILSLVYLIEGNGNLSGTKSLVKCSSNQRDPIDGPRS